MMSMKNRLIGILLFVIYSAIRFTWRIRVHEPESLKTALREKTPMVFAHWHGQIPGTIFLLRRYKAAPIISTSKDGDFVTTVSKLFGSKVARGSSTRGGSAALKKMIKLAREGWRPALAIDGPKGPRHEAKSGIFEISRILNAPIYPLIVVGDREFIFQKAWDKTAFPKPFAKIQVFWGDAIPAVSRQNDSRDPDLARGLEHAMANAERQARDLIAAR